MSLPWRIMRAGVVAALVVWTTGALLERLRFGASDATAAARVEAELQRRFDQSTDTLGQIASQVAAERQTIIAAPHDTSAVKRLFDVVDAALPPNESGATGITVYDGSGEPLAWAGRVSELLRIRVNGPASLFVALGEPGPRFFRIEPVVDRARLQPTRLATIVVEEALGELQGGPGSAGAFVVRTSLAPVTLRTHVVASSTSDPYRFVIASRGGGVLADAVVAPADLVDARTHWANMSAAAAILALIITILLCVGPLIEFRRQTTTTQTFLLATTGIMAAVLAPRALFGALLTFVEGARPTTSPPDLLATGLTVIALVWILLDLAERRRVMSPRRPVLVVAPRSAALIGAAYLVTAVADTVMIWRYQRALEDVVAQTTFDLLHVSHSPLSAPRVSLACGLLLLHAGVIWLAATIGRLPTLVWRPSRSLARLVMVPAWLVGAVLTMFVIDRIAPGSMRPGPLLVALAGAGLCTVALGRLGAKAQRASQAMRLFALLLALLGPAIAMYPSLVTVATAAQERVIATEYGPQAADQRLDLENRTRLALGEIDDFPGLAGLFAPAPDEQTPTSDQAFRVWSRTSLATYRLTSAVELYAPDGHLVSRFALVLPEYAAPRFRAEACGWDLFDEPSSPESNERYVLAASRSVCERGRVVGTIVVRAMLDYRTLPFLASASPYVDLLQPNRRSPPEGVSGRDIEFVAYGWSRAPLFASGTSVWRLSDEVFQKLLSSRAPFWITIDRDDEPFRVYFLNDRAGIYAIGYPVITWFGHLINLVELGTLTFALYILLLAAVTLFNVLTSRTPASGRALLRELRSSFYRKLAFAFVAGAVVPVVILAVVTRTYFATELRAGIDDAAARTATVAQRLVEDYAALQQRGSSALEIVDDQIMGLVRRAIDQDVNLYDRAHLQATSERDFFESQLLSMRTPADVYRAIALDHLPTFVVEKQEGDFRYRMAAAPVRAGGREGIVTVPLPLRQQEIEQQIDQLDHRVLFAAVFFGLTFAALGYWMAERIADPVSRLTRATRRIARGDLDARIAETSSDELRRLVADFNQMAADLQRQRSELERTQRLEAWADMARQVAHDIKNPLTPIQLSAEHARRINLDRGRPLSPVLDDCVNAILTQVRLLRQIAGEFSSFGSSPTAHPEPTRLTDLVDEVIQPYRTGLTGRIAIETQAAPDLPNAYIDRTLFSRALINVVENALHAMPGNGQLTILESGRDGTVVVEVSDTGVGMDPQSLAKIFEPYFSTKASGTGLGLTIAKRNIELSGGTISVVSERGVGTTVTMTVPIAESIAPST